jgi:hypothetical protein
VTERATGERESTILVNCEGRETIEGEGVGTVESLKGEGDPSFKAKRLCPGNSQGGAGSRGGIKGRFISHQGRILFSSTEGRGLIKEEEVSGLPMVLLSEAGS